MYEAPDAYLFLNVFRCSCRIPIRSILKSRYSSHFILEAIPRTSESANVVPDETFTMVVAVTSDTSLGGAVGP